MTGDLGLHDGADTPVEEWGFDRLLAAVEQGSSTDWNRIGLALESDPRGKVAAELEDVVVAAWPSAAAVAMGRMRLSALAHAEAMERCDSAAQLQVFFAKSGLTIADFAGRLGVTEARASTYLGGTEAPPVDLLARAGEISA